MGIWSKFKEDIVNPIADNIFKPVGKKFQEFNESFQVFKKEHPRFTKVWNFLTHPTMLRVYAIAGAIAFAPFTGGFSTILAVKLGIAFGTSLISVVAKAIQRRNFRILKLQRGLANYIVGKHSELQKLKKGREKLFDVLRKNKLPEQTHQIDSKIESKFVSFLKTLRDFSAESILPTVSMAFVSPPAALSYIVGLVSGASFISGELTERTNMQYNSAHMKDSITGACKIANIPPYKNSAEFYKTFRDKMIEHETMKRMCKVFDDNPTMTKAEIKQEYKEIKQEVSNTIEFKNMPSEPNLLRSFWHETRPWGKREISYELDDKEKEIISYKAPELTRKSINIELGAIQPRKTPEQQKKHTPLKGK